MKMMKSNPWASIKRLGKGIDSERIDPTSQFDFFWALGRNGEYLFIIEHDDIEDWPTKKIALSGIDIQQHQLAKGYRLSLVLNESSDWDIFYILSNDLLQATSESKTQKKKDPFLGYNKKNKQFRPIHVLPCTKTRRL